MNIMICNDKELKEFKKYFLENAKLNISNAKTSFGIFDKNFYMNDERNRQWIQALANIFLC